MLKFLAVVIAFAVPIICGVIEEKQNDSLVVKKIVERSSNGSIEDNTLKNCNAEIISFEQPESLLNCVNKIDDFKQLSEDGTTIMKRLDSASVTNSTLSEQQNSATINIIRKYCTKSKPIFECVKDSITPSIDDCRTDEQIKYKKILLETYRRGSDFLCANNAERAEQFINEKFIDCITFNQNEVGECVHNRSYIFKELTHPSLSAVNFICSEIQYIRNCLVPKLNQCKFSEALGTLTQLLLRNSQPDSCAKIENEISPPTQL